MPQDTLTVESVAGATQGTRVLRLKGPITLSTFFDFQNLIRSDASPKLILDLTEVPYVDSSGIGCLVNGYISHHMAGGRLILTGVNKRVRETLHETRVEQFFSFYPSVADAENAAS